MDDHRAAKRKRVLKGAVALGYDVPVKVPCMIRDMSESGCRIHIGNVALPNTFELLIEFDGISVQSEVVWRRSPEVGVRFISPIKQTAQKRSHVIKPVS